MDQLVVGVVDVGDGQVRDGQVTAEQAGLVGQIGQGEAGVEVGQAGAGVDVGQIGQIG